MGKLLKEAVIYIHFKTKQLVVLCKNATIPTEERRKEIIIARNKEIKEDIRG